MFVWNSFMTRSLRQALGNDKWVVPLVHGYWSQQRLSGEVAIRDIMVAGVCVAGASGTCLLLAAAPTS